jgi:hypothetical protein
VVVEITQSFRPSERDQSIFRGGCTLLIDLSLKQVRYLVRKRIDHAGRFAAQQAFAFESAASLRANYYGDGGAGRAFEPFALLHSDY